MAAAPPPRAPWLRAGAAAADRQRKLDELARGVLRGFVGRAPTPENVAAAEGEMRAALERAIRAGTYVPPDGLALDRVELGDDLRLKVYFAPAPAEGSGDATSGPLAPPARSSS